MKPKEAKEGQYIHWIADRQFRGWDVYGKITKIKRGDVSIITFDDFKETTIALNGEAMKGEIKLASKQEAEDYIALRKINLTNKKAKLELEHQQQIRDIDATLGQLDTFKI